MTNVASQQSTASAIDSKKQVLVSILYKMQTDKQLSQNELADHIGISRGHIGNVLKPEAWTKVGEPTWNKLFATWLPKPSWKIYNTINKQIVFDTCEETRLLSESNCISEYTGSGKTTALVEYAKITPNTYYICANPMFGVKTFLKEFQKIIGIDTQGTNWELATAIINHLKRAKLPFVIIDEIDKLNEKALLILKVIFDNLKDKCGFLLAGTEVFRERIDYYAKKNRLGYREIKRRFCNYVILPPFDTTSSVHGPALTEEILYICNDQGITNKSQIAHILNKAEHYGDLYKIIQNFKKLKP
jgi:DNA transposition AAA+ family ATPase